MKAKHVFTTLGLAFVMGAGVVAGIAANKQVEPVKATNGDLLPNYQLVGAALGCGWNDSANNNYRFTEQSDGTYKWTGSISVERFRVTKGDGTWTTQLNNANIGDNCDGKFVAASSVTDDLDNNIWCTTAGTYSIILNSAKTSLSFVAEGDPDPIPVFSYSINSGTYVDMVEHQGSEVKSNSAVTLAVGDTISFKKDGSAYEVNGKKNTKVVNSSQYTLTAIEAVSEVIYLDYSSTAGQLWAGQHSIANGYYVVGDFTGWDDTRFAVPMTEDNGVYTSATFAATNGQGLKIVHFTDNVVDTWLSVKNNTVYTTTSAHVEYDSNTTNAKITADVSAYYVKFTASEIENGSVPYVIEDSLYTPDIPAEDGYYICGEFSSVPSWKYAGATKMTATTGENVAYEMNFNLAVGDELRVRSYFSDRPNNEPADQWATLGDNGYADPTNGWGEKSGDNFKATKAGYYDIYAKYVNSDFMFFVAPHVDSYQISLTAKLYEGRTLVGTQALDSQLAYANSDFTPTFPTINGYVGYRVFEDADCITEYDPKTYNAAGQLYLQYMREGYYVAGDETFSGNLDAAWNVEGAVRLNSETPNDPENFAEGTIVIPASASAENPVEVKPMRFSSTNQHQWLTYALGASYSFVSVESGQGNLAFTKGGTFAVYVKMVNDVPTVWLNEGINAFNTKFLTDVGGICNDILLGTKTIDYLRAVWEDQKAAFESLSAEEKEQYTSLTINDGNENGTDLQKVIAKYSYIVHKYGTNNFEDFIWGQTYTAQSNNIRLNTVQNNVMVITLVSATIIIVCAGVAFYFLRKRRLTK